MERNTADKMYISCAQVRGTLRIQASI